MPGKVALLLANSADFDEILSWLHCLPKYPFRGLNFKSILMLT